MRQLYPFFSQNPLDRLDLIRENKEEVEKLICSKDALFLLFDDNNIIVNEEKKQCLFKKDVLDEYKIDNENIVLLGKEKELIYFAISLKTKLNDDLQKIPLREFTSFDYIKEKKLGIVAQGASVLNWHETHLFCSSCGETTKMSKSGWKRNCLVCNKEHFPRVDSVVIMLVTYGEYCLIGHGVNFKENIYSCLAGYMESGETLEDAAKRELFEESGVVGFDVEYMMSQPWPFPTTLMVGMRMKAKSQELTLNTNEIEDAIWVHKEEIREVLNGSENSKFLLPGKIAIARNLLEIWIDE
jgi:NAD+ diphosphatase